MNNQNFKTKIVETKTNFITLFQSLSIAVLLMSKASGVMAQEKKAVDLKDFKIIIEHTEDGVKMQGIEGSAWIDLSFDLNNDRSQAVDEYGAIILEEASSVKDKNLADFLFTITRTEDGLKLKGIEGTAWTDLSFPLGKNHKQAIDQNGMTSLD